MRESVHIRTDVQLEIQFQGFLIPRRIARTAGIAQDRTCLPELLQGIEGRRMFESGQGTGKSKCMADRGGNPEVVVSGEGTARPRGRAVELTSLR